MPDATPLNIPIETRPTPEVLDTLFYEFLDPTEQSYVRLPEGSEHEKTREFPGFKLVKEDRLSYERSRRWWSNGHQNQDVFNYSIDYSGDSNTHKIFTRRYLYRRDEYDTAGPATKGAAFTGVYLAKVTDGGENYDEPPTITVIGGGGTGCTVRGVINKSGELAWAIIVTEGTGFTSAPTATVTGGGGTNATVTLVIQPTTAYLVKERVSELPQDDPRHSLFIAVVRIYETLPGPITRRQGFDMETGATTSIYKQRQLVAAFTVDSIGDVVDGEVVIDSDLVPDPTETGESTVAGTAVTWTMSIPPSRLERTERGYSFPAKFVAIAGWAVPAPAPLSIMGPCLGVHYTLTQHRTASRPAICTISYSNGPSGSSSTIYTVTTPGSGSRFFPIGPNTVHAAYELIEVNGASSQIIETVLASTPSTYTPGATLIIGQSERKFKAPIWEKRVYTVTE